MDALNYAHKERRFTSYADFVKEMRRTGVPMLPEKAGGYTLKYGEVTPQYPKVGTAVYRQTLVGELDESGKQGGSGATSLRKDVTVDGS